MSNFPAFISLTRRARRHLECCARLIRYAQFYEVTQKSILQSPQLRSSGSSSTKLKSGGADSQISTQLNTLDDNNDDNFGHPSRSRSTSPSLAQSKSEIVEVAGGKTPFDIYCGIALPPSVGSNSNDSNSNSNKLARPTPTRLHYTQTQQQYTQSATQSNSNSEDNSAFTSHISSSAFTQQVSDEAIFAAK